MFVFGFLMILTTICIVLSTEKENRGGILAYTLVLILFTTSFVMDFTEHVVRMNAIKNNAAHWEVKVDPISGNSTKVFKWGQPVNKPNENQTNEPTR